MINVLIRKPDAFSRLGMVHFISDLFRKEFSLAVNFNYTFTGESVRQADVVILYLCPEESLTCIPELRERTKGIVIGMVAGEGKQPGALPSCFSDITLISLRAPLVDARRQIAADWQRSQIDKKYFMPHRCLGCRHQSLSSRQSRVMSSLVQGEEIADIAYELNISDKTVFTHKYLVMQKFNLKNEYELVTLMHCLADKGMLHIASSTDDDTSQVTPPGLVRRLPIFGHHYC